LIEAKALTTTPDHQLAYK